MAVGKFDFVFLSSARLDAVHVVHRLEGVLAFLVAARAHRWHILVIEQVVALGDLVRHLESDIGELVSARVIPLLDQDLQMAQLVLLLRVNQVLHKVKELAL